MSTTKGPDGPSVGDPAAKPDSRGLRDFPLLVYAPTQWGTGIRTNNNGTLVDAIAARAKESADRAAIAAEFDVTEEHVKQAVDYVAGRPKTG